MPARRIGRPRAESVTLRVDGEDVSAVRGEPVAMSLLAAGRVVLGRSVKYHRARGAVCFAARCDGCLMRVNGVPSVRTCAVPAEEGLTLETQNVLGSAELDLLSAADWFFPGGMNHHEMFTWARPVNEVMQRVAREIAGVGTLPDEVAAPIVAARRTLDVLVIGAGVAGLAAAWELAKAGRSVLVVDEAREPGGWARLEGQPERDRAERLVRAAGAAGVELSLGTSALGIFDEPGEGRIALLAASSGALRVRARAWVLAPGRQEGAAAFEGNDLPGVIGAEAAARLLAHDIVGGERIVLAGDLDARGPELERLASALREVGAKVEGPRALADLRRADGRNHVTSVTFEREGARQKLACDLLVVGPRTSAAYELAVQAGARAVLRDGCFELVHAPGAHATWIVGAALGAQRSDDAMRSGEHAAREIVLSLGGPLPSEGAR